MGRGIIGVGVVVGGGPGPGRRHMHLEEVAQGNYYEQVIHKNVLLDNPTDLDLSGTLP